jgi:hypothetical protein
MNKNFIQWLEKQVYILSLENDEEWQIILKEYDGNWNWTWKEMIEWDE